MHSIWVVDSRGVEDEAGPVSTAGEHLPPLVEGGALGLEEDVPLLQQAEAALLGGGVVPTPSGLDGPGDGVGGACPLQGPHMLAEGGALGVLMLEVEGVAVVP